MKDAQQRPLENTLEFGSNGPLIFRKYKVGPLNLFKLKAHLNLKPTQLN